MIKRIKNWLRREESIQTATVIPLWGNQGELLAELLGGSGRISPRAAMKWYNDLSSVATVVDMIADAVRHVKPVLWNGEKFDWEHEVLQLLNQPNGFNTYNEFISSLSRYYNITGSSYVVMVGNPDFPPLEIYTPDPSIVNITPATDGRPLSYLMTTGDVPGSYERQRIKRDQRYIGKMKELYHITRFSSSTDQLRGDSPLDPVLLDIKQQLAGRTHNVSLLEKGGRLSLVITLKNTTPTPDKKLKQYQEKITKELAGAENAGHIALIEAENMDIQEFGTTNKDMDYFNLDTLASKTVALRYGVPLSLISEQASTYNNMEQGMLWFMENTAIPHIQDLFNGLSKALLPKYGIDPREQWITVDPSTIQPIMRQKLAELKLRKEIGVETVNELRQLLPSREDVEGGDVVLVSTTSQPLGNLNQAQDEEML